MNQTDIQIRWLIRRDMPEVLAIEQDRFGDLAWSEEHFVSCLRERNCIGMIAESDDELVGYMIYQLHKNHMRLLNLAVSRKHNRQGIGRLMLQRLKDKLSHHHRDRIELDVRESNLAMQLLLKATGFKAVGAVRGFYDDTGEDCYEFRYTIRG